MSENSCILVKEIDCDNVVVAEEQKTAVIDTTDPVVVIVACEQGPPGQDGLDGTGVVEVSSGPVANGNTVTADSVPIANNRSAKWIVTLTDGTAGDYKSYEVLAVHNGTTPLHTVYALIGDPISVTTDVDINAGNLRLRITNNSPNSLSIKVQRIVTTV